MFSVIFDMDGTLLDTQRICIPAWDYAGRLQKFENMGQHIPHVCGMNEAGWTKYLENNFPALDVSTFKKEVKNYIQKNLEIKFKPGAVELLNFLKEIGVKMAVASGSGCSEVKRNLEKVRALSYFDAITGGSDVKNGKPAPDIFLHAADLLGVKPDSCFVFEDSANGVKAAHTAGMKCIGIPDIVAFDKETEKMMFAQLNSLSEAIEIFNLNLFVFTY